MVTLLLWSMRAGTVFVLQLDVLSHSMFVYSLISAWKMGLCLTHLHPEELHLVRNKKNVLHNHHRPICSRPRPNHPRLRGGATWKVGFLNGLCGILITFTIVFKSPRCLGERWRMVVPPHLAYGDSGAGDSIPGQ